MKRKVHMRRPNMFLSAAGLVLIVGLTSIGCSSSDTTPTDTTTTVPVTTLQETFTGTLLKNGALTHQFAATASGSVTVVLNTVSPDTALAIGMSLGTWNGSSCQIVIANDRATEGISLLGVVSGAGTLCVRMYDVGTITDSEDYIVQVSHP